MEDKSKFFQVPICMLKEITTDKQTALTKIISYGICVLSVTIKVESESKAATQMMYDYYRHKDRLTPELLKMLERYINKGLIDIDDDFNGFSGDTFSPEWELESLIPLLTKDSKFRNAAIQHYQLKTAFNVLGISGNYGATLKHALKIKNEIPDNEPFAMIKTSILFDYRDNNKSEFELMQLLCFIAISSILGKKQYIRTNKNHILSRMFGYRSVKALPDNVPELHFKYSNRYHMDKLLLSIETNWNVLIYSNRMRGIIIGNGNKTTLESIIYHAESRKMKNKVELLKQAKNEARERVLQQLKQEQQLK